MGQKHYEYKRDEVDVGMVVAKPNYIYYGGYRCFRHPVWSMDKVKALTPKKTKITLESGRTMQAQRSMGEYRTGLFKPDELMEQETAIATAYKRALGNKAKVSNIVLAHVSDEKLTAVATKLQEIVELLEGKTEQEES